MADRHATAPAPAFGLATDFIEIHPGSIEVEIEMKIDIEVVAFG